jgi:hypothetical protein
MSNIDTKTTHLENVYNILKGFHAEKCPIFLHDEMKEIYTDNCAVYHEAAFDAFVTGASFIWMAEALGDNTHSHCNKVYLMKSIYSCFNLKSDEVYLFPDAMAYCLKAIKQTNDIDLKTLLEMRFFDRIKKCFNVDTHNSLIILVHLDTSE